MLQEVTKDRTEEIAQCIVDITSPSEGKIMKEVNLHFEKHLDDEISKLLEITNDLYGRIAECQRDGKIGKVRYIRIFTQKTELLNGRYRLKIQAYDDQGYELREEISSEWNPDYLTRFYDQYVDEIIQKVSARMFRMTTREKSLARFLLADRFGYFVIQIIKIFEDAFYYVENRLQADTEEIVALTFGSYLEEGVLVNTFSEE